MERDEVGRLCSVTAPLDSYGDRRKEEERESRRKEEVGVEEDELKSNEWQREPIYKRSTHDPCLVCSEAEQTGRSRERRCIYAVVIATRIGRGE